MRRRPRRDRSTSRGFVALAVVIIVFLLLSSVVILIPLGSGGDDDTDDVVVRVTPGAEVARLETRIAENPDNVDAIVVLAEVLANSGRIAESIPWFERAIEQRPDDATLRLAFGRALQRAGNTFDAQLQLSRAHELDPANPATAFHLGLLHETREPPNIEAAREWYGRAIETAPDSVVAEQARDRLAALDPTATPSASP